MPQCLVDEKKHTRYFKCLLDGQSYWILLVILNITSKLRRLVSWRVIGNAIASIRTGSTMPCPTHRNTYKPYLKKKILMTTSEYS